MTSVHPVYPIGPLITPTVFFQKEFDKALEELKVLPRLLDYCLENLDAAQLNTSYRKGGWSIHQIIHHLADSHMNAFVRTKLMLTEEQPTIKPYLQDEWVHTADVLDVPANYSVTLLHALHHRWVILFKSLEKQDLLKTYYHPEYNNVVTLWQVVHNYAWHGKHHSEQIRQLRIRKGW